MKIKEMQKYYNYNNMYLLKTIRIFADDMVEDIKLINQYSKFNFKSSIEEIIKIKNKYIVRFKIKIGDDGKWKKQQLINH